MRIGCTQARGGGTERHGEEKDSAAQQVGGQSSEEAAFINTREGKGSCLASAAAQREGTGGKPYEKHHGRVAVTTAHPRPLFGALNARRGADGVTSASALTSEMTWPLAGT